MLLNDRYLDIFYRALVKETTILSLTNVSEFQIRWGIEYNSKIIFLISQQIICCDPSLEPFRRDSLETVLMMGRNIHFKGIIWKIIVKLSLLPLLIWSTVNASALINIPCFFSENNVMFTFGIPFCSF